MKEFKNNKKLKMRRKEQGTMLKWIIKIGQGGEASSEETVKYV